MGKDTHARIEKGVLDDANEVIHRLNEKDTGRKYSLKKYVTDAVIEKNKKETKKLNK